MKDIIINNSNVVIENGCTKFKNEKANKLFNLKTWKRSIKIGRLRFYVTWNLRLKGRNKRDNVESTLKNPRRRHFVYKRSKGRCDICGKELKFEEMELHHVLPLGRFRHLATNYDNMQCLCHSCHKDIHCDPYKQIKQMEEKAKEFNINLKDYFEV